MHPLTRARPLAAWLLVAAVLAGGCSGRDVSLGEDLHTAPTPTFTPAPTPTPIPTVTPTPAYPCETNHGTCLASGEPCGSGRFVTRVGYECGADSACCVTAVGTGTPGAGGANSTDASPSGAGGE